MPLRPFPFPISIGIDICHIPRIRSIIVKDADGQKLERFARRIFRPAERAVARERFDRYQRAARFARDSATPNQIGEGEAAAWSLAEWLAGRFAAKEAAIKAVHSRKLSWHDIRVERSGSRPIMAILDPARPESFSKGPEHGRAIADKDQQDTMEKEEALEAQEARVTISHDGDYATAVVMAFDEGQASIAPHDKPES